MQWTSGYGLAECTTAVLDGANLCWSFGSVVQEHGLAAHGDGVPTARSGGLTLAMNAEVFAEAGLDVVAFLPQDYVEGPLWSVCDGARSSVLPEVDAAEVGAAIPELEFVPETGLWRNRALHAMVEEGRLVAVTRSAAVLAEKERELVTRRSKRRIKARVLKKHGSAKGVGAVGKKMRQARRAKDAQQGQGPRSRDDVLLLRHAQEVNGWVVSNDRYRDHRTIQKRGWRGWVAERRLPFEFAVDEDGGEVRFLLKRTTVFNDFVARRTAGVM